MNIVRSQLRLTVFVNCTEHLYVLQYLKLCGFQNSLRAARWCLIFPTYIFICKLHLSTKYLCKAQGSAQSFLSSFWFPFLCDHSGYRAIQQQQLVCTEKPSVSAFQSGLNPIWTRIPAVFMFLHISELSARSYNFQRKINYVCDKIYN